MTLNLELGLYASLLNIILYEIIMFSSWVFFAHAYANGSKLMLDSHSYGFLQSVNCY